MIRSDIRRICAACAKDTKKLPSRMKSGREALTCGGLGKEETQRLMGFPSFALSINNTSRVAVRLLKNLKSRDSNSQHAFDEISLTHWLNRRMPSEFF